MPMSSKLCFVSVAFSSNRASCSHDASRSWSFADKCVTKLELGHECAIGGLGRLAGDLFVQRGNGTFYFPIVSCLVVSAVLTLLAWLFRR